MTRPRTRLRRLIGRLGPEAYEAAREYAWRTAAATGRGGGRDEDPADEPAISGLHELAGMISHDEALSDRQRVGLAIFLYREMPSYAVLMHARHVYEDFGPEARAAFWAAYRALLDEEDDRLAAPVAYSLRCGYLDDDATADEAWAALTEPGALGRRGTERLLELRRALEEWRPLPGAPPGGRGRRK